VADTKAKPLAFSKAPEYLPSVFELCTATVTPNMNMRQRAVFGFVLVKERGCYVLNHLI
jgi:hypothetical protein